MPTKKMIAGTAWLVAVLVGISPAVRPQQQPAHANSSESASAVPQSQANLQSVSATGLFPVYGIELRLEKGWVDSEFPSKSSSFPNTGVSASLQQAWDSLNPSGFNILRVPVDLRETQDTANRVANLCAWAKNNNVKLLLVLAGASGQASDYDAKAGALIKALIANLRQSQYADSYLQIAAYQLDEEVNHSGLHGQMSAAAAQQLVLKAAQTIRAAERQALQGTGAEATPLMASASFDYELIQARAIAGTPLSDEVYNQAYSALTRFLQPLAASPDIDLISVTWSPGTVSAGAVDKPPVFLRSLTADISGKQIVFTTGFSTAFASPEEQKNYYTLTFANLGDLRATAGEESPFMGVVFREALNGKNPQAPKGIAERMPKWDWSSKAGELADMWNGKRKSEDMKWWWEKIQSNMGLVALQRDTRGNALATPQPAQQALGQIASAVSETSAAAGGTQYGGQDASYGYPNSAASVPGASSGQGASGTPGSAGFKEALQGRLMALVDAAIQRVTAGRSGATPSGGYPGAGCPNSTDPSCASAGQYPSTYPTTDPGAYPSTGYPQTSQYPQTGQPPQGQYPPTQQYPDSGQYPPTGQPPSSNQQYPQAGYPQSNQYPSTNPADATTGGYPAPGNYPGQPGSILPGSILVTKQDVSILPANPQVGQMVNIRAKLRNQGPTDATGLILLASDQNNTVLAQTDSLNVPRGSPYPVTLQWVPSEAQTTLPITLHVSDALGNEIASASLDPIRVAAAPAGSGPGAPTVGGATASGEDAGGSAGGKFKFRATAGFAKVALLQGPSVADQPVNLMASMSNPLGIPMRNIQATLLVDGVAKQTQTISLLLPHQSRSLVFPAVTIKKPGTHEVRIVVQAQRGNAKPQVGYLVSNVVLAPPTSKRGGVGPRGPGPSVITRPGAAPTGPTGGSAAAPRVRPIFVPPATASARHGSNANLGLQPLGTTPAATGTTPPPSGTSTGVRPSLKTGSMTQGTPTAIAGYPVGPPASNTPGKPSGTTQPITAPVGSTGAAAPARAGNTPIPRPMTPLGYPSTATSRPNVSLNASEISYTPATPKPGQPVVFNVVVRNQGAAAAPRVMLVLKLYADGKLVAMTQSPIQFAIGAKGTYQAKWQAGMPSGRQIQLLASVAADGDTNPMNKQVSIGLQSAGQAMRPPIAGSSRVKVQH